MEILVEVPAYGPGRVSTSPEKPLAADVAIASLLYASKIRWVLLSEPEMIGEEILRDLMEEAVEAWGQDGRDLIDRMETGRRLRSDTSVAKAAGRRERFRIGLIRSERRGSVLDARLWNTVPLRGMAANLPWTAMLVLDHAEKGLDARQSTDLRDAVERWVDLAFIRWEPDPSVAGLQELFSATLELTQRLLARWVPSTAADPSG